MGNTWFAIPSKRPPEEADKVLKVCRKCRIPKAIEEFSPRTKSRDGRRAMCRDCVKPSQRAWASRNGNGARRTKKWKNANADKVREADRARRHGNVQHFRAKWRRQYAANAEKRATAAQQRRDTDRDGYNAQVRKRRAESPELNRAVCGNRRARLNGGIVSAQDILAQLAKQNRHCFYCAVPLTRYEVDHFISLANGGAHDPSNIVIACPMCNRRKNKLNGDQFIARLRRAA